MTELIKEKCRVCLNPFIGFPMGEKNGYNLFSCRHCGSVMVDPWVTAEAREQFLGEIQPEITHVANPAGEIQDLKKTIAKVRPDHIGKRYLDITARNGYSVVAARQLGIQDVHGIDQHEFFTRFAQTKYDHTLFDTMTIQEYAETGKKADIILSRDGFCEQLDLESFTAAIARTLASGGVLYIEEPDGNSFNTPRNFGSWQVVFPPMNFVYLSKRGITSLLERHGLRIQKVFFNWRPVMRLVVVKN